MDRKAKYVYKFSDMEDYHHIKNVSQLSDYISEYQYGDLISFDDYRDVGTCIIGKNGNLIHNEDKSASGYLSIPYEITKHLDDAVSLYSDIHVRDISIRYDDKIILNNINTPNCKILEEWNWEITWFPGSIHIIFPNGENEFFNIKNTDTQQILDWYQTKILSTN